MKRTKKTDLITSYLSACIWMLILAGSGVAQTTAFTYQGKLTDAGNLASGSYDMQFKLFDTVTVGTGSQQGSTITNSTVQVTNGIFAVNLDFGTNVFTGAARYLEIGVRPAGSPNPHTILAPRQPITSSPYAIQTVNAQQLGGLPASRYVATDVNGNVGIGTATPSTKLEVVHPISQLRFGPTAADNGGYLVSTNPSQAIIAGGAKFDGTNWIARGTAASLTAHQDGVIQFFANCGLNVGSAFTPALRMQIDYNGKLFLTGSDAAYTFRDRGSGSAADDWALYASDGKARLYNNTFGDVLSVTADGKVGIGTTPTVLDIRLDVRGGDRTIGVYASTSTCGTGVYGESACGTGVYGVSTIGIGVHGQSQNEWGVYGQSTNSYGVFGYSLNSYAGYFNGNVFVNGTVTQGSDARLKQNISTLNYGLSEVLRLRPVTWRWKEHPDRGRQLGLVAQEVEPVLPELVSTSKDAEQIKGINYTGLLPVLVNAIKEQQARINQQQTVLEQQQTLIKRQQRQLEAFTKIICQLQPQAAICQEREP